MISVNNREILRRKNREVLTILDSEDSKNIRSQVIVEEAKTGAKTIKAQFDGISQYIHSKYSPENEAERIISEIEVTNSSHFLFIGVGLGYHVHELIRQYPNVKFSIYEPNVEILKVFLDYIDLSATSMKGLQHIFTGTDEKSLDTEIHKTLQYSDGMIQLITLPVYEKQYKRQVDIVSEIIIESLKSKKMYLAVNLINQKRWTVNSIKNFPTVTQTPNIMHDFSKADFLGKPAIIVAAGPSLTDEIENLRTIRENESAYIFSVGSAINTLVEEGIYPHATCAYDPSGEQWKVLQKVKDKEIKDIPLVFGSSIGFEALEKYDGKMIHMLTSPDTVSPQLLDTTQSIDIVLDAPTIAAITFQILSKLECNPIVLVGQNLAYKDEKRYATGISYDFIENEVSEKEKSDSITIKDVLGNDIQTSESFNMMRKQLEYFIQKHPEIEVINTTTSGALIEGTTFVELSELIEKRFVANAINSNWFNMSNSYDKQFIMKRVEILSTDSRRISKQLEKITVELQKIEEKLQKKLINKMEQNFVEFDKQFAKLKRNPFYIGFIEPMLSVQNNRLSEVSKSIRFEQDVLKKADMIINSFGQFINEIGMHYEFVKPYFEEMKESLLHLNEKDVQNA